MDLPQLVASLQACVSHDPVARKSGEEALNRVRGTQQPGSGW